jgi:hypothetical protein
MIVPVLISTNVTSKIILVVYDITFVLRVSRFQKSVTTINPSDPNMARKLKIRLIGTLSDKQFKAIVV